MTSMPNDETEVEIEELLSLALQIATQGHNTELGKTIWVFHNQPFSLN